MPGKILVVDDVATNRIILKAKLGIACYDVVQAGDGPAALQLAQTERPDLVLLDLAMPGMGGLEVLQRLKADSKTAAIPVVVVTSRIDARTRIAALRAGAEDFLSKPVDDMILSARVRAVLRAQTLPETLDLTDGPRRALGFSDAQMPFETKSVSADEEPAPHPHGRVMLIGATHEDHHWVTDLDARIPQNVVQMTPGETMRFARPPSGVGHAAGHMLGEPPEAFIIRASETDRQDGMMLLSELRSSPGTCHTTILVAFPADARPQVAMALDLGASDVFSLPCEAEEIAHRLSLQLARAQQASTVRRQLRDGLHLAVTDALTGLPNRRYGLSHLGRAIEDALQKSTCTAVMMLDLDRFKDVNDVYGHAAGDAVLRAVSARLQLQLRSSDFLARIGGEEFLVVLPCTNEGDVRDAAERLRRAIDAFPIPLPAPPGPPSAGPNAKIRKRPSVELHQTLSIGFACGPSEKEQELATATSAAAATKAILERADAALLRAKATGRNRVVSSSERGGGAAAA